MHPSGAADVLRTYRRAAGCDGKHHVSAFSNLLQQFVQVFQSCLGRSASQLLNSMVLTSILVLVTSISVVLTSIVVVLTSIWPGFSWFRRAFQLLQTIPLPPAVWSAETSKIKCPRTSVGRTRENRFSRCRAPLKKVIQAGTTSKFQKAKS